ncbi:hypothetical protein [Sphingosinicella sp. YJ22]|uniref:hypothetical protein n=1 Tax=Sphingosinicella sp. YJ22 TaxID=1104780 RepID=UPI00140C31DC|nr:hypothetical protein [Sphingosinicella sp. YJ22]
MKQGSAFVTAIVLVLLVLAALKLIGVVIGFALKVALVVVLAGVGVVAWLAVQKRLEDWRAP